MTEKYENLIDEKAQRRERKKRKKMPISGKSVFKILEIKRKKRGKNAPT